jgi:hypothetical protein
MLGPEFSFAGNEVLSGSPAVHISVFSSAGTEDP